MRELLLCAALFGATIVLSGCGSTEAKDPEPLPPLALDVALGSAFDPGDKADVPVTVVLTNIGKTPAFVNSRLLFNSPSEPHEIVFEVIGPDKAPRRFSALVNARSESRDWKSLPAGGRVFSVAHLARLFDLSQPGFYAVQAIYENKQDSPAGSASTAWKGSVASPVLRFERK